MTPELWQRLKPLYEAALDVPKELRPQFVANVCKDDVTLKCELEKLLQSPTEFTFPFDNPLIHLGKFFGGNQKLLSGGQVLSKRFEIVRHLGSGGMGDVYEALDLQLQKGRIALKVIRPSIAHNPATLKHFKSEVILARRISGPHVCRIHEFFEPTEESEPDCVAFLTMEYLEGTTLSERIAASGPPPLKEATSIAYQLCAAFQSIHEVGVVHRDLKPRNIMLVPHNGSEKAVVMDFGLAHAVSREPLAAKTTNTSPGLIMGTPEYMAPEQFEGREVCPATDIYALGLVLYELVTGKQVFEASTPFAAAVRRGRRPDQPSSVRHGLPPVWDDVIAKCLEFDVGQRYQSAAEVAEALHKSRVVLWRFRHGQRIALAGKSLAVIAAAILVVLGIGAWFLLSDAFAYHMSPDAQYWYDQGVNDLREGTYLKATKEFDKAVNLDKKYPLTHARLAEAWTELDLTDKAANEMLSADRPDPKISLSKLDRLYIDALRTTLIPDYSAAAQDYEAILKDLPKAQKPQGMVDLGRAYEKAGRTKDALLQYEEAAALDAKNPAPFVHIGILKSRSLDEPGADAAFTHADDLYKAKSNLEGQAEVEYQRGYSTNELALDDQARDHLYNSLIIACQIKSVQLEVRALSQLSSVEYNAGAPDPKSGARPFECKDPEIKQAVESLPDPSSHIKTKDQKALKLANLAIALANRNGLEYWSTDGEMRLGNTYLDEEDYANAKLHLQNAINLAHRNQHPRLEAYANLAIATAFNHEGDWDREIDSGQKALQYLKDYGFVNPAIDASVEVIRGEEGEGEYARALQSAIEVLQLAQKTDSKSRIILAEETVGSVWLDLGQYPTALVHSENALKTSKSIHQNVAYETLYCVTSLWRLGRYDEAEEMLVSISADDKGRADIAAGIASNQAQILLSQGQFRKALTVAQKALQTLPEVTAATNADLKGVVARSYAELDQGKEASQEADQLLTLARREANKDRAADEGKKVDEGMVASAELVEAEVALHAHLAAKAMPMAQAALQYFKEKDIKQSEWMSLLSMAEAAKESGDEGTAEKSAKEAIDILRNLEQNWGSPVFRQYSSRPDIQVDLKKLSTLKG